MREEKKLNELRFCFLFRLYRNMFRVNVPIRKSWNDSKQSLSVNFSLFFNSLLLFIFYREKKNETNECH